MTVTHLLINENILQLNFGNKASTKAANLMSIRKMSDKKLEFSTLQVSTPHENVYLVQINRPEKRNAMSPLFFK